MKIITVIGARPQFIKAAVVSRVLSRHAEIIEKIVHTGQHFDFNMSDIFFSEMEVPKPAFSLSIKANSHGAMTGRMLECVEEVLLQEKPDLVLVYGDTNSTLAGALAAAKLHIPVAHVEAGLRSFNTRMPEEINRVLTDHISEKLFAPTERGRMNLIREGLASEKIFVVGDVMYDAAIYFGQKAEENSRVLSELKLAPRGYILATCHRAENTDVPERLQAIFKGLSDVAEVMPVICPLHPRARKYLQSTDWFSELNGNLKFVDPVGYLDMVALERNAAVIATDSGGVQKEAFFYKVPCVTLRDETEWVELVDSKWNILCPPTSTLKVASSILNAIGTKGLDISPYGKGNAGELIVKEVLRI